MILLAQVDVNTIIVFEGCADEPIKNVSVRNTIAMSPRIKSRNVSVLFLCMYACI